MEYYTYLKLRPGVDPVVAIEKCNKLNTDLLNTRFGKYGAAFESITEPLTELHTGTRAASDLSVPVSKSNLIFIIVVTFFILAVALSNFISLYIIQGEPPATNATKTKSTTKQPHIIPVTPTPFGILKLISPANIPAKEFCGMAPTGLYEEHAVGIQSGQRIDRECEG